MGTKPRVRFGVVGSGWRASCYLKTAELMGDGCIVTGIVSRSAESRAALAAKWGCAVFPTAAEWAEKAGADFLLVAVSGSAALGVVLDLLPLGIPLLIETSFASSVSDLVRLNEEASRTGARIQVAEQYWLQPMHSSRLALLATGAIGEASYAHVSVNHSFHNVSLLRKYLGLGFDNAVIRATSFSAPLIAGPGRDGDPEAERLGNPEHQLALLDFGGKRGLFDFEENQHRSWVRTPRVLVRGERGEISDSWVSYLKDYLTPVHGELDRVQTGGDGNFEGYHLKGVMFGEQSLFRNETSPARLSDEEIAQAQCLLRMKDYVVSGKEFYSLAEASQDAYLALMLRTAEAEGRAVETTTQPWAAS